MLQQTFKGCAWFGHPAGNFFGVDFDVELHAQVRADGKELMRVLSNLINNSVTTPGQSGQAAVLLLLVLIFLAAPMIWYTRSTARSEVRS
jgi:hypothetical protein